MTTTTPSGDRQADRRSLTAAVVAVLLALVFIAGAHLLAG